LVADDTDQFPSLILFWRPSDDYRAFAKRLVSSPLSLVAESAATLSLWLRSRVCDCHGSAAHPHRPGNRYSGSGALANYVFAPVASRGARWWQAGWPAGRPGGPVFHRVVSDLHG